MSLERRLSDWVEAGLIDEAAAARILAHERRDRRPVLRWALVGLGLLAVALGVLLLVSANWDRIPSSLKLGAHMLALLATVAGVWRAHALGRPLWMEALLFLFAGLVLGGLALQAQVYQLTGPAWHLLLLWLLLAGPALFLGGTTRLTAALLAVMAILGPAAMAEDTQRLSGFWLLAQGMAMAVPVWLLLLSLVAGDGRPAFRLLLKQAGLAGILAGASIVHLGWAVALDRADALANAVRLSPLLLAVVATLWLVRLRGGLPRPLWPGLLLAPLVAVVLALVVPHGGHVESRILGVVVYAAFWGLVARGAIEAGWNGLFAVAVAALAVRIFVVYLELFGSLAATGGGLVAGGLLLLALGWGWQRLVARLVRAS